MRSSNGSSRERRSEDEVNPNLRSQGYEATAVAHEIPTRNHGPRATNVLAYQVEFAFSGIEGIGPRRGAARQQWQWQFSGQNLSRGCFLLWSRGEREWERQWALFEPSSLLRQGSDESFVAMAFLLEESG